MLIQSPVVLRAAIVALALSALPAPAQDIPGSATYRPEVVGKVGVVAAGRHFAA